MQLTNREGLNCKVEERMSVPLLATWPAMEEREKGRYFWWRLVELCGVGFLEKMEFWKNGKGYGLWRKEGNKGKGKRKRN